MRKTTVIFSSLVLALCSLKAAAQMPDPTVGEGQWAAYDIGALKAGEYVEYEMSMMGGAMKSSYRMACVGIEGDTVWIESNQMTAMDPTKKDMVILYGVDKKTRMVTKALLGKAGEAGKELKIDKAPATQPDPATAPKITGTGKVSNDKVKVKDTEFDCERLDMETHMEVSGMKIDSKSSTWSSEKVAFKMFVDDKKDNSKAMGDIKWEGKPSGKGALVKMTSESSGMKTEITLTGWGTDAKKTLK
ncbi:MAG: hypothetical protein K8T20_20910 [Planctomycetes bacterium]|nr:hypothetical protein [Planctomycetota bacterium]